MRAASEQRPRCRACKSLDELTVSALLHLAVYESFVCDRSLALGSMSHGGSDSDRGVALLA